MAYKPTTKPAWDKVSLNLGGRRRSTQKIGPPEGDVAAGSPKGETGELLSCQAVEPLIADRRTIEPLGSCAANRQAIEPLCLMVLLWDYLQLIVTCCNIYEMRTHTHPCILIRIHE